MIPTSIDGTDITGATIDGQDVQEITVDGQTVFSAGPPVASVNRVFLAYPGFRSGSGVRQADVTTKYSMTGFSQTKSFSEVDARGVFIRPDGTKLFVARGNEGDIVEYSLSTPYDIGQKSENATFNANNKPYGIDISDDGLELLTTDDPGGTVFQFTMSSPYDLSTVNPTATNTFTAGGRANWCQYMDDGDKFGISRDEDIFEIYSLSTTYDISSRSLLHTHDITKHRMGFINPDGTKYFRMADSDGTVDEFALNTPFDITDRNFEGTTGVNDIPVDIYMV